MSAPSTPGRGRGPHYGPGQGLTEYPPPATWRGYQRCYRMRDGNGNYLYVGITNNPASRLKLHERTSPWLTHVARIEWGPELPEETARREERVVIELTRPLFNRAGNPDYAEQSPDDRALLYQSRLRELSAA